MNRETQACLESALAAARQAGKVIRDHFGRPVHTEYKGPTDFVTEIDRRCELMIRESLKEAHPEIGFWGEEFGRRRDDTPTIWLVDPLDGTKNFVHGYPFVAVCIAMLRQDQVILGVVYDPLRDEMFHAVKGGGAYLNESPIEVSRSRSLQDAVIVTSFSPYPAEQKELIWKACQQCQGIRRGGASALDLCQLAAGRLDAVWEWHLRPWDIAAASLIIQEAQGTVTHHDGLALDLHDGRLLATNTTLHKAFVDFLADS